MHGPADDSYGIEVAKLAGIPDYVISRSKEILKTLSLGEPQKAGGNGGVIQDYEGGDGQLSLLPVSGNEIVQRLKGIDVNTLTPIESMQVLYELVKQANLY